MHFVGLQESEASCKPLAKGTSLFSHGCSAETEVPSHPEGFVETKESDEQQSAFSFHTVQTDLACEKGLAFHREFCTTNCMYPGCWMHKSYGLPTSS